MSNVNWTESQSLAIKHRNSSVAVSAGAGSGKTAVLTERVLKLILSEDYSIDDFLIVTFTVSAAAEMREKIAKKLRDTLKSESLNSHLQKQLMLLPNARISTIDSFCNTIVKDNFSLLDISPDFNIMSTAESDMLKSNICDEVLDRYFDEDSREFELLTQLFNSDKDDTFLKDKIIGFCNFADAYADPEGWIKSTLDILNSDGTVYIEIIRNHMRSALYYVIAACDDCLSYCEDDKQINYFNDYKSIYQNYIDILDNNTFDDFLEAFKNGSKTPCQKLYGASPELKNKRENFSRNVKNLTDFCLCSTKNYYSDRSGMLSSAEKFAEIALDYWNCLSESKHSGNTFDFSDIEHLAYKALCSGITGYSFKEILIDEYQDTNDLQDKIFAKVSDGGDNFFVVGDVKQSIYRFRKAMPEIFINKQKVFDSIKLRENFRCDKDIIDFTNCVFDNIMSKSVGDIDYKRDHAGLISSKPEGGDKKSFPGNHVEYCILSESENVSSDEAVFTVQLVKKALKEGSDDGKPIKKSDICILSRTGKRMQFIADELKRQNINCAVRSDTKLFDSYETAVILSLLRVINNPMSDIPLLSVMMSPLFGFSADEMARIRLKDKSVPLYSLIAQINGTEKLVNFKTVIKKYRQLSSTLSVPALMRQIYSDFDWISVSRGMQDPVLRQNNLNYFLRLAEQYSNNRGGETGGFVRYIDSLIESGSEDIKVPSFAKEDDAVSIMTIHASKGLEFPVVILAGLSDSVLRNSDSDIALSSNLGIAFKTKDAGDRTKINNLPFTAIDLSNKYADTSEIIRLLYVAMTRARNKLYLVTVYNTTLSSFSSAIKRAAATVNDSDNVCVPYNVFKSTRLSDLCLKAVIKSPALVKAIGDYAGIELETDISIPNFDVLIMKASELLKTDKDEEKAEAEKAPVDEELFRLLKNQIDAEYKYRDLSYVNTKIAASALGNDNNEKAENYITSKPHFLSPDKASGAEIGTATHSFMQYVDYEKAEKDIDSELLRLKKSGFLTEEAALLVETKAVGEFFESELYKRIKASDKVLRERKFTVNVSACEACPGLPEKYKDENVLIQGIADCVFYENDELVIVDYKTDRVKTESELTERYKNQLKIYARAFSECTGRKVSECILYSFTLGKAINV